jgi:hypothetical protein
VAAGGATDAQCGGGEGEKRGGMGQITAHSNPYASFSLSFFPLCVRRGFDEKFLLSAVQYMRNGKSVNLHHGDILRSTVYRSTRNISMCCTKSTGHVQSMLYITKKPLSPIVLFVQNRLFNFTISKVIIFCVTVK